MTEIEIMREKFYKLPWIAQPIIGFVAEVMVVLMLYKILRYTDRHHVLMIGIVGLVIAGRVLWRKYRAQLLCRKLNMHPLQRRFLDI